MGNKLLRKRKITKIEISELHIIFMELVTRILHCTSKSDYHFDSAGVGGSFSEKLFQSQN